jgi:hypothetical protein
MSAHPSFYGHGEQRQWPPLHDSCTRDQPFIAVVAADMPHFNAKIALLTLRSEAPVTADYKIDEAAASPVQRFAHAHAAQDGHRQGEPRQLLDVGLPAIGGK